MRTIFLVALVAVGCGAAPAKFAPHVSVPHRRPVVVQGAHFRAHERVTVTFATDRMVRRTVTANLNGVFSLRFPGIYLRDCDGLAVIAAGNRGSHATLKTLSQCSTSVP
jgi:hypothetical protein